MVSSPTNVILRYRVLKIVNHFSGFEGIVGVAWKPKNESHNVNGIVAKTACQKTQN